MLEHKYCKVNQYLEDKCVKEIIFIWKTDACFERVFSKNYLLSEYKNVYIVYSCCCYISVCQNYLCSICVKLLNFCEDGRNFWNESLDLCMYTIRKLKTTLCCQRDLNSENI